MVQRKVLALTFVVALAAPLGADEVVLRSGGRLTGEILERGSERLVIDVDGGQITLPTAFVQEVVPGLTPQATFRLRAEKLAQDDVQGWLELGHWARGERLEQPANRAFMRVLFLQPGNVAANLALGRVQLGERWVSPDEAYRARGYVRFEERWMLPDERDALQRERALQAEVARAQQARAEEEARLREAEARAREAEARAQEAMALARAAEADRVRVDADRHGRRLHRRQDVVFTVCTVNGRSFFCNPPLDPYCVRPRDERRFQHQRR